METGRVKSVFKGRLLLLTHFPLRGGPDGASEGTHDQMPDRFAGYPFRIGPAVFFLPSHNTVRSFRADKHRHA
jgi:hypothetical protein